VSNLQDYTPSTEYRHAAFVWLAQKIFSLPHFKNNDHYTGVFGIDELLPFDLQRYDDDLYVRVDRLMAVVCMVMEISPQYPGRVPRSKLRRLLVDLENKCLSDDLKKIDFAHGEPFTRRKLIRDVKGKGRGGKVWKRAKDEPLFFKSTTLFQRTIDTLVESKFLVEFHDKVKISDRSIEDKQQENTFYRLDFDYLNSHDRDEHFQAYGGEQNYNWYHKVDIFRSIAQEAYRELGRDPNLVEIEMNKRLDDRKNNFYATIERD
jgi:hypothetical protein